MNVVQRLGCAVDARLPWLWRRELLSQKNRSDMHYLELSNCFLRYRARLSSSRPTLVLMPDPPVVLEHYDFLLEKLSAQHSVVVFEPPGTGFSVVKPGFTFSFDAWVDSANKLFDALQAGPYVLAFPCLGGFAALAIANSRSDVKGLITLQTANWHQQRAWALSRSRYGILTVPIWGQLLLMALKRRRASRMFPALAKLQVASLQQTADQALSKGALFPFATAAQCYLTENEPDRIQSCDLPALSIWGDGDDSHHVCGSQAESIREYLPHTQLVRWKQAGHFPEMEEPQLFFQLASEFLSRLQKD